MGEAFNKQFRVMVRAESLSSAVAVKKGLERNAGPVLSVVGAFPRLKFKFETTCVFVWVSRGMRMVDCIGCNRISVRSAVRRINQIELFWFDLFTLFEKILEITTKTLVCLQLAYPLYESVTSLTTRRRIIGEPSDDAFIGKHLETKGKGNRGRWFQGRLPDFSWALRQRKCRHQTWNIRSSPINVTASAI